jgi:enolase
MPKIDHLTALEILDSRGRPTVQATCHLASGASGTVSIPSGASTGRAEALELRDGDKQRFRGLGCRKAVNNISTILNEGLRNRSFDSQQTLDHALLELDGSPDKSHLGANALLGVSLAFARATARERRIPLYQYFAEMIGESVSSLPMPMINLLSGGKHAGGQVAIQDVQIVPVAAQNMSDALAMTFDVFYAAADLMAQKYGMRLLTADEGGLAPPFTNSREMLDFAVEAIHQAGFQIGTEVALTIDVAASHFYHNSHYHLDGQTFSSSLMVSHLMDWLNDYPIISIEDGLAEEDWEGWSAFHQQAASKIMVLGDDLLCTNTARIQQAIDQKAANALLLKVNQIGTLSEAGDAKQLIKPHRWKVVVSARSGETEDHWLADLAIGWSSNFIKVGSITQSERLAKYNRLLLIEQETKLSFNERK